MHKKIKSARHLFNSNYCYSDILDLFNDDSIEDKDIAQFANIDIDTVRKIKREWVNKGEDTMY